MKGKTYLYMCMVAAGLLVTTLPTQAASNSGLGTSLFNGLSSTSSAQEDAVKTVKVGEVVQAGTVIPVSLLTALTSDNLNGTVVAMVRQNVYDSVTGKNLLIPAGSKVIGEATDFTGKRINVSFTRIIFPNGHSVMLPDMKGIDGVGYSGLKDKYTSHSWLKTRSILNGSIFAGAITALTKNKTGQKDTRSASEEAVSGAVSNILNGINNQVNTKDDGMAPTGTVRIGYQFNIIMSSDVQIKPYLP